MTGQVGGGPWVVSKHTENKAAALDFVKFVTTANQAKAVAPGYPSYGPAADSWLKKLDADPYYAAPEGPAIKAAANLVWQGWNMVTYPDQRPSGRTASSRNSSQEVVELLLPASAGGSYRTRKRRGYKVVSNET